jgi:hypothetical protein
MHCFERELRSLPAWLLRAYLEELGGRVTSDDCICGDGWQARLEQMEDYAIGSLRVGQVRLIWKGNDRALQEVWPRLEQKLARAGG